MSVWRGSLRDAKANETNADRPLLVFSFTIAPQLCFGQGGGNVLFQEKVSALKSLNKIQTVFRISASQPTELISVNDLSDFVVIGLRRHAPDLAEAVDASDWLQVSLVMTRSGGWVSVSVYRHVRVLASGMDVFAPVWSDGTGYFGSMPKADVKEGLDNLLIRFSADYLRASRM